MYQVQKQKGITLIALVIIVIVLIILAGVAINLTLGENGILRRAEDAGKLSDEQAVKEKIEIVVLDVQIEEVEQTGKLTHKKLSEVLESKDSNITLNQYSEGDEQLTGTYTLNGKTYSFIIDSEFNVIIGEVEVEEPKPLSFGEITWTSGKASLTITSEISDDIEYQVNGTADGNWTQGNTVTNLEHEDIVYARINDGTTVTEIQEKQIKDETDPEEFEITTSELTYEAVKVSTTGTTDNQTGLATYSYVAATSSSEIVKEITNQTVTEYTIKGLSPETEYVVYMLAYDNAGNVRKSNEVTVKTKALMKPTQISTGRNGGMILDNKGSIWTIGLNDYGQIGNGETDDSDMLTKIITEIEFVQISRGLNYALALDSDGYVWGWGHNNSGQLGDGTTTNSSIPVKVAIEEDVKFSRISAGSDFSLAIDMDGNIWAWGNGYLGNGKFESSLKPVKVVFEDNISFKEISVGEGFSLAIDMDGNIWAWGRNNYGQIGNGKGNHENNGTKELNPVKLNTSVEFTQVSAGNSHALALDNNGDVWAWGNNRYGQVGNGGTGEKYWTSGNNKYYYVITPKKIMSGVNQISAGYNTNIIIDSSGYLWQWGTVGSSGYTSVGTTVQSRPEKITSSTLYFENLSETVKFDKISLSVSTLIGIDTKNNLWIYGGNTNYHSKFTKITFAN